MRLPLLSPARPDPVAAAPVDLDALRRSARISVDREGFVCHEAERIAHPRLQRVLQQGLEIDADGRAGVRFGHQWAPVTCERTPFVVTRATLEPGGLRLRLNTGADLALPIAAVRLRLEGEHDLYVAIDDQAHEARFGRTAWMQAADWLDADRAGNTWLQAGADRIKVERVR